MSKKTVIVAIPTFNEADSIGQLTKIVDAGLTNYFKDFRSIILNVDNDSPDNTKGAFLDTPTKSKKVYLSSKGKPKEMRGKGFHMKMALQYAKEVKAEAISFLDGDIVSATTEWVPQLLNPIFQGYDHVLPIYLRNEYDASITNHLAFPVLFGVLKANLRHPLAGEVALSKRAVEAFLSKEWPKSAYHYGVDIFLVTTSIFSGFKFAEVALGVKEHKPSAPKLNNMFLQVADSLFRQLYHHRNYWQVKKLKPAEVSRLSELSEEYHTPHLYFDYKHFKEEVLEEYSRHRKIIRQWCRDFCHIPENVFRENGNLVISAEKWAEVVLSLIGRNKIPSQKELLALRVLYFGRFLTFFKEVLELNHRASEQKVIKQAKVFNRLRHLAVESK